MKTVTSQIIKLHEKLIEIQSIKSPSAVQGLQTRISIWKAIEAKLENNKKLTKDQTKLLNSSTNVIRHLNDYISKVS